jgi:hypothetical protein
MTLKSVIKIPLTIIFMMVLVCDLWIAFISFFNVHWIEIIGIGDGPTSIKVKTVFTWGDGLAISLIIILSAGLGFLTYRSWIPKKKNYNLKPIRTPITIILGLIFLYDYFFIYNIMFHYSLPNAESMGELVWGNYPIISYWIGTILILAILIAFQVGLGYLTYKAWSSKSHQSQAVQA